MLAKSMYEAVKIWWPEYRFAYAKDAYAIASESERVFHSNNLKRVFEQAKRDWTRKKYGKAITQFAWGWQQYVIRALQAADQAGMAVSREWKMALYGSMAMREAKLGTKQIAQIVDVVKLAKEAEYQRALDAGYSHNDAQVASNEIALDRLRQWFADDSRLGIDRANQIDEAALYDSFSIVGRRPAGVDESAEGFLSRYLGVNWAMRRATEARMEGGGASILTIMAVGFMNVPLRTARYYAGFGPYGLLRWGINRYRQGKTGMRTPENPDTFWEQSYHNALMSKARLREALVGTALAFGFLGWQQWNSTADDDAEKRKFGLFVTGMGPSNRSLRDAWHKRGFQPFTLHVVVNGKVVSQIPVTRAGQILGFPLGMAAAVDDLAWRRKQERATGRGNRDFGGRELAAMGGTYYQIVGAQGVFQAAGRLSQIGQGEAGMGRFIGMQTASLASGLLPGKSLVQNLSDILYGSVDRSSIVSGMVANFPVLSAFTNGKAINRFGDVIGDRTWEAKAARLGFPVLLRVSDTPENKELYQTLLNKGAAPPDLRRYIVEEKYGPLTQAEWSQFVRTSGVDLKGLVQSNLRGLKTMRPEDVKSFMNRAGQIANENAAAKMNLTPQKQVYRGGGGTGGGGGGVPPVTGLPKTPRRTSFGRSAAFGGRVGGAMPRAVGFGRRTAPGRRSLAGGIAGRGRTTGGRLGRSRRIRLVSGKLRTRTGRISRRRRGIGRIRKVRLPKMPKLPTIRKVRRRRVSFRV